MAKERVEKTLIILEEAEVRAVLEAARQDDPQEIYRLVVQVIAKKVEVALRRRCS